MKDNFSKITGYFQLEKLRNDKRIVVFSVCLFIATTLWFLNALSKDYSTTLTYPVKYTNPPQNQFLANHPPEQLELKVNAHGFSLLRNKLNFSLSPIILNLAAITRNIEHSANGYRVNTNALVRRISDQISSEITINSIQPEIFFIKLDSLKSKTIAVKPNIELGFKSQFHLKKEVQPIPDSVKITGPSTILDTISFLYTKPEKFGELDNDTEATLDIIHPENIVVYPKQVKLKIDVEKFTEKELTIPIGVKNKPDNISFKLFPSEIKLTVLVGLSDFENIGSSKFEVFVDYKNIVTDKESLSVDVLSKQQNIQIIRFSPLRVEYLIETK